MPTKPDAARPALHPAGRGRSRPRRRRAAGASPRAGPSPRNGRKAPRIASRQPGAAQGGRCRTPPRGGPRDPGDRRPAVAATTLAVADLVGRPGDRAPCPTPAQVGVRSQGRPMRWSAVPGSRPARQLSCRAALTAQEGKRTSIGASPDPSKPAAASWYADIARRTVKLPGIDDWQATPSKDRPRPLVLVLVLVLVHGSFGNADNYWIATAPMPVAAGYLVFRSDYGALPDVPVLHGLGPVKDSAKELSEFVDRVLTSTGASQVDIVSHSGDGLVSLLPSVPRRRGQGVPGHRAGPAHPRNDRHGDDEPRASAHRRRRGGGGDQPARGGALDERAEKLEASRAANRELTGPGEQVGRGGSRRSGPRAPFVRHRSSTAP